MTGGFPKGCAKSKHQRDKAATQLHKRLSRLARGRVVDCSVRAVGDESVYATFSLETRALEEDAICELDGAQGVFGDDGSLLPIKVGRGLVEVVRLVDVLGLRGCGERWPIATLGRRARAAAWVWPLLPLPSRAALKRWLSL